MNNYGILSLLFLGEFQKTFILMTMLTKNSFRFSFMEKNGRKQLSNDGAKRLPSLVISHSTFVI